MPRPARGVPPKKPVKATAARGVAGVVAARGASVGDCVRRARIAPTTPTHRLLVIVRLATVGRAHALRRRSHRPSALQGDARAGRERRVVLLAVHILLAVGLAAATIAAAATRAARHLARRSG